MNVEAIDEWGDPDRLVFNGVNGVTGEYLHRPATLAELGSTVLAEKFVNDPIQDLQYRREETHFGIRFGVNPEVLAEAGWALIAAEGLDPAILDALAPLRQLRTTQAAALYREFTGQDGMRRGDTKRSFLARAKMGSALPVNPERVPYYILLVGGADDIPFQFQYQLDVQYAVGRLFLESVEDYAAYARTVVDREDDSPAREVRLFGPRNRGDRATQLSADHLLAPLATSLAEGNGSWEVARLAPEASTKDALATMLAADAPLVMTASHGVGFPTGHALQDQAQGALVCAEWAGPVLGAGGLSPDTYFSADDVDRLARVGPRIMLSFACYSAGTPREDDFSYSPGVASPAIAPLPFVARLPQRLLAHEQLGLLAFVGHVDRAWGCSFVTEKVGPQQDVFDSALRALMAGWRVGHAMDFFNDSYSALADELAETVDGVMRRGDKPSERQLARLWTQKNDARNFIILGDPAVRVCVPRTPDNANGA